VLRGVAERINTGVVLDSGLLKAIRRVLKTNGTDNPQLVRTVGEMRDRDVIAELISTPSKLPRLRPNFKLGLQHLLVVVVTPAQHHPVLAEGNRLMIAIGRDVFDRENRHCRPSITHMPMTCISRARFIPLAPRPVREFVKTRCAWGSAP